MRLLLAAALLLASSSPADAYGPRVREARQWARAQVHVGNWRCLDRLWERESGWSPRSHHPVSGAHGIPQAVPGRKMGSVRPSGLDPVTSDWRADALTQVRWGLRYVRGRYGTPCHALRFQSARGWY